MGKLDKIRKVVIFYDYEDKWELIEFEDSNGNRLDVSRESIEAFLRMQKVLEDLSEVEKLRETLNALFETKEKVKD